MCACARPSNRSTALRRRVRIRDLATGEEYDETYDKLILAPGAAPIRPPLPGIDLPGIFTLRNLEDMDRIIAHAAAGREARRSSSAPASSAWNSSKTSFGADIHTTVVELQDQVLPPFDKEMTTPIAEQLASKGVTLLA